MTQFEIWSLFFSVLTLIFLAVYVWKTWQMATSNKDMVDASNKLLEATIEAKALEYAPYLYARFEVIKQIAFLTITNAGKTPARQVVTEVKPDISRLFSTEPNLRELSEFWKDALGSGKIQIAPGQCFRIFLNSPYAITDLQLPYSRYEIQIRCLGGVKKDTHSFKDTLDLQTEFKRLDAGYE